MSTFKLFNLYLTCGLLFFASTIEGQDRVPPQARCKTGLVVVLPQNGEVVVMAEEFDDGSTDNVTAAEDLKFFFNGDPLKTEYIVNCDTFEFYELRGEFKRDFFVHILDEAGNMAICGVEFVVQDNKSICGDPFPICSGCPLLWGDNLPIEAYVNCNPQNSGCFSILVDTPKSVSYCLDEGHLNGVSTKDLLIIQRHLLGITSFTHPYQFLAADVNNNNDISVADISSLRKVILGREADFQRWGLESYHFFVAQDTPNINTLSSTLILNDLVNCPDVTDFTAVKVGDVEPDSNGINGISTRTNIIGNWVKRMDGQRISFDLDLSAKLNIVGMEAELTIPKEVEVDFVMGSEVLGFTKEDIYREGDRVKLSWISSDAQPLEVQDGVLKMLSSEDVEPIVRTMTLYDEGLHEYNIHINEVNEDIQKVFPNPIRGGQNVHIPKTQVEGQELMIYNIQGQRISMPLVAVGSTHLIFEVPMVPGGHYLLNTKNVSRLIIK